MLHKPRAGPPSSGPGVEAGGADRRATGRRGLGSVSSLLLLGEAPRRSAGTGDVWGDGGAVVPAGSQLPPPCDKQVGIPWSGQKVVGCYGAMLGANKAHDKQDYAQIRTPPT